MHGLPGGGAEMLVDDVRLDISPKKGSAENWLRVMSGSRIRFNNICNKCIWFR